ncbi:Stk1 family PASTA domain-containing Ser/Thr kinase [Sinomonas sp. ASV486]|uniref:Stk1 family PASTA domain-containing Ser/Thr kinase n=1 Tax=Sinomonas sp. ASV486 TaxID=3051170 RepID=UPI0027DC2E68|nr:Stk1 family PASTA domain-containing Ser/Thr kinase [Sinomonas sp. ASV486]MDQ4491276.1 Stk1 family PASTA domain-containing Ser/Thr kinase [Sinomonas sp. ASV486]
MPAPIVLSGRYELGGLIGRGGMADVYEGLDLRLARTVAVKMLRPDMARDGQFRTRFEREARAVAGLNHPSIVAVYDTGEHNAEPLSPHSVAVPYIVMEYVDGQTLRDLARERKLSVDECVDYTLSVLAALEYSHRQGIVHRDIKPANVMVCDGPGAVKVMDFGIARATADTSATMTQTQAVVGTAQYLSPEQAQGETVDARSDLYSTGCLLYELLTGRPPFVGESAVSVALQHVQSAAAPAAEFNPDVTPALQSVLDRALEKDPENRFASAAAFQRALRAARAGVSVPARAAAMGAAAAVAAAAAAAAVGSVEGADDDGIPTVAVGLVGAGAAGAAGESAHGTESAAGTESTEGSAGGVGDGPPSSSHLGDTGEIPAVPPPAAGLIQFDDARDEERARRGRGRRRTWIVALIIAALLIAGGGGIVLYNYMNQPSAVQMITVPSVTNMSETEAALKLQGLGLQPDIKHPKDPSVPKGKAIRTVPDAGTQLAKGASITLDISDGPSNAVIPDSIIGATEAGARSTLQGLGLTVKPRAVQANDPKAPIGTVISTNPGVGQTVGIGTEVELTISSGKVDVPDVRGESVDAARKALSDKGLSATVQEQENSVVAPGTVTDQSPLGGTIDQGGTVTLIVAKAPAPAPSPTPSATPSPTSSASKKGNGP